MQQAEKEKSAKAPGKIRYVDCQRAGYCRRKSTDGFEYLNTRGKRIDNPHTLKRVQALVIPPKWREVWICPHANGHIQATGIDQKGRKQYLYHSDWKKRRRQHKFASLVLFGQRLNTLRKKISQDLARHEMDLKKVCALAIEVMDRTAIRPGNESYRQQNGSYGLTTLNKRHLHKQTDQISFIRFIGKKGIPQQKKIRGKKLLRLLQKVKEIPGQRLFQYYDDQGKRHHLDSGDLNYYLQEAMGIDISCKTFRTWNACISTLHHFIDRYSGNPEHRERLIQEAINSVAELLGNSPRIAKAHYIAPKLLETFQQGRMDNWLKKMQKLPSPKREEAEKNYLITLIGG